MSEELRIKISGDQNRPVLIYLPGLHGDWTLNCGLRESLKNHVCFVELAYPVTNTWKLSDYPKHIEEILLSHGITTGWLLGESFGSQVAWAILGQAEDKSQKGLTGFQAQGLILAGGFVCYPLKWAVRLVRNSHRSMPLGLLMGLLKCYLRYVKHRHRKSSKAGESLDEHYHLHNREDSKQAILSRYDCILESDPRPLARRLQIPVYYLTGFWDPIVMWFLVQPWLKRNCQAYKEWKLVWASEHNVLGFQPEISATQILTWMNLKSGT